MSTHYHLLFAELLRYLKNKCRLKNKSSKRCVNIVIMYHGQRPPIERGSLAKFREISRQKSLKSENKDVFILGFESMVSKIIINQQLSQQNKTTKNHSSNNYLKFLCNYKIPKKKVRVQLNKYETDPYFLQIFQSSTSVCLIKD